MNITKAILADSLSDKFGFSKQAAKDLVDDFFKEIVLSLENGKDVKISGFGNFKIRSKNARPALNPRTREKAQVEPRRVVTFRAGNKLKDLLDNVPTSASIGDI